MAYIRDRASELTGYQVAASFSSEIDLQCDFVMVYGLDANMPKKIQEYRENGYVVHLMTGVAWGAYSDYLNGEWDGRKHWDEAQLNRYGDIVGHCSETVPYMVPTISFADYLTEKIKPAIDAGVEAVHLEEPEYLGYGGYAEAFKREYEFYYKEPWKTVDDSVDNIFKSSRVMAYLYTRTVDRVCSSLKEYAKVKYNKNVRFYVATHSLLSYCQIRMVSPESLLTEISSVDGYIAQIWTGTSRAPNEYQGVVKERTFESGFLEYGIMQEMVKGTGQRMWFLHDPVEDDPKYDWDDYEYNYIKTVVASLYQPHVWHYEICPWPDRVFDGTYPKLANGEKAPNATAIPDQYRTVLSNIANMLGDMEQVDYSFDGIDFEMGVLIADSCMYQRSMPDSFLENDPQGINADAVTIHLPDFFGIVMPLIKYGIPIRPVQLDNVRRFSGYLADYKVLLLTYEFFKPESPDINISLANFVADGGVLIYIGDGSDPFHDVSHWWNKDGRYHNAAEHLFESLGLAKKPESGIYSYKNGFIAFLDERPAMLVRTVDGAEKVRQLVTEAISKKGYAWTPTNKMVMRRGPYIIASCLDESVYEEPIELMGKFVDMTTAGFSTTDIAIVNINENKIFYDVSVIENEKECIIGSSVRIMTFDVNENEFSLTVRGVSKLSANIRLRLPYRITNLGAVNVKTGQGIDTAYEYDSLTDTVLISFKCDGEEIRLTGSGKNDNKPE